MSNIYDGIIEVGNQLADLPDEKGGWNSYFAESEDGDLRIPDTMLRAHTAIILENAKRELVRSKKIRASVHPETRLLVCEDTRSPMVGGFSDHIFPIIRAAFPASAHNDLVSVQATNRKTATIVFWNWIVGGSKAKGLYVPGQKLFDANRGKQDRGVNFSNNVIEGEQIGSGNGAASPTLVALQYTDGGGVKPGSVRITATVAGSPVVVADDGNGGWLNSIVGSINYKTGAIAITFGGLTTAATPILAQYRWDSEGSPSIPQIDVQITTSTAEVERRAMRFNYSAESLYDVMMEFGVSLEPNLLKGAAEQINAEIGFQLVEQMWEVATAQSAFALTGPTEYSRTEHYRDFIISLTEASNSIWATTQKGYGNRLVVDEGGANLIESLPGGLFSPAPRPSNPQGLHFVGTVQGKYQVYKDIHLSKLEGASATGNVMMTYKGDDFYQAGLVYAPYQLMYESDTLQTADMINQKGLATRYATKMVNPDFFTRIPLSA